METTPLGCVVRLAPAAALLLSVVAGGAPVQAATGSVVSSPGDLALSLGTPSVSPMAVGQLIFAGMSITNTSAVPIGPFTYTFQGSANTRLSPNFADPHTCTRAGGNSISCIFMGALQPGMMDNSLSVTVTPLSAGAFDVMASVGPALGSSVISNSIDLPLTAIVGSADLQLTQRVSNAQPAAGAPLTYTIDIKNALQPAAKEHALLLLDFVNPGLDVGAQLQAAIAAAEESGFRA